MEEKTYFNFDQMQLKDPQKSLQPMDDRVADFLAVSSGKIRKGETNKIRVLHVRHIDWNWKIDTNCDLRDWIQLIN